MKVSIGPYRNRWISEIHTRYMNRKYGIVNWSDPQSRVETLIEKFEDSLQWVYNHTINVFYDAMRGQKIKVRIDRYDTWSMDHTLAPIILPMLKQLKESKHGAPFVDDKDVPKELKSTSAEPKENEWDTDSNHFKRWDWVLDEMIWAFEQKNRDHWEGDYYGPWIVSDDTTILGGEFESVDRNGLKSHQKRMSNGFKLFGKYYEGLWD